MALQWLGLMFEEREIRQWCRLHWPIQADVAAQFRRVGMSPEQAVQRIWHGRLHRQRRTLAQQVQGGDITIEQAQAAYQALLATAAPDAGLLDTP